MSTFTVSDWKAAFKTLLEARDNLTGVVILDAETPLPDTAREAIVLGDWEATNTRLTFTVDDESYIVEGSVRIWKPDSAKTARDRALVVLKEVKDQLVADPATSASVFDTLFAGYRAEEDIHSDGGRICTLEFTIQVEAHQ